MSFFEIKGLVKTFGGLMALNDINLSIEQGEIVGLIGPNGSGKTTLFNCINNFCQPDQRPDFVQGQTHRRLAHPQDLPDGYCQDLSNCQALKAAHSSR